MGIYWKVTNTQTHLVKWLKNLLKLLTWNVKQMKPVVKTDYLVY